MSRHQPHESVRNKTTRLSSRLVIAIVATSWAGLIAVGLTTYFSVRTMLLADLDESIITHAMLAYESGDQGHGNAAWQQPGRTLIQQGDRSTMARRIVQPGPDTPRPDVIRRSFATLGDGSHVRTLSLAFPSQDGREPSIIIRSEPAQGVTKALWWLALSLCGGGAVVGLATGVAGVIVARRSIEPIRRSAESVQQVDLQDLGHRLSLDDWPSEMQAAGVKINDMLARLERSYQQRQRFLADVSHELRTPVSALLTTLELAHRRLEDQHRVKGDIDLCLVEVQMLHRLISDLFEHVRHQAGLVPIRTESVQVAALIRDVVAVVDHLATRRGVTIETHCDCDQAMVSDRTRLERIVRNLLTNAVEHSPADVIVEIHAHRRDDQLWLVVTDQGPGLPEDMAEHAFGAFRSSRSENGAQHLGLGLHIVQLHTHALGGQCEIATRATGGTEATVTLPWRNAQPDNGPADRSGAMTGMGESHQPT